MFFGEMPATVLIDCKGFASRKRYLLVTLAGANPSCREECRGEMRESLDYDIIHVPSIVETIVVYWNQQIDWWLTIGKPYRLVAYSEGSQSQSPQILNP